MMRLIVLFFFSNWLSTLSAGTAVAQGTTGRVLPAAVSEGTPRNVIPLEGIWKFKLDPFLTGISSNGLQLLPRLPDVITLPGSTDEAAKGYKSTEMSPLRLTRRFEYKGAAWYEKEVFVPSSWKGKSIRLFLERAHWQTDVWVNDRPAGKRQSLSVPHIYEIASLLRPGEENTIRIRVDNDLIYNIGYSHAVSAETQTNWNGIIGKIELQAFDKLHIEDLQVFPHLAQHTAEFRITVRNPSRTAIKGTLSFSGHVFNTAAPTSDGSNTGSRAALASTALTNAALTSPALQIPPASIPVSGTDSLITVTTNLPLGKKIYTWDEFDPALYGVTITLQAEQDGVSESDSRQQVFGIREIATRGTRFTINGRPVFIRGTVNSAEFPLTGYPPMEKEQWRHIFTICKDYGLNAMRFHSWCPPEAAFAAADEAGIYLQVENTDWRFTVGKDEAVNNYLKEEADRILATYGNHPSFMMFCEGNELVGPTVNDFLSGLLSAWKKDPRHLYTGSSGYPVIAGNQYNDFYGPRPQHWKEGLNGRFNAQPLNTLYDYAAYVANFTVPLISHEIGQWCVYPDFDQIPSYTGVLKPYNYQIFRESLRDHHMIDLAKIFTLASGKFQVIQKKEEIESYLRTPGLGGYHLLQLNDFPGQGTAPVGVVDQFWNPKFYTTAKEFSHFQSARVPLLRTSSFTWTNDQVFTAALEFANFGSASLKQAVLQWSLQYPDGTIYAKGQTPPVGIPLGSPVRLDSIHIPLDRIRTATALTLRLQLRGMDCSNQWEIWVYPRTLPSIDLDGIKIAREWNDTVKEYLNRGATVLLLADTAKINSIASPAFSGISWNTVWSGMPPDLLGILCDPKHPALAFFPTEFYSNWQWWDLVRHSKPMVLDRLPASFRPLVQMIPDWNNNRKIGLILEAKVGKGKLLLSAIDLRDDMKQRPVAAQLLYSLEKYVSGQDFNPAETLSLDMIDMLFKKVSE